MKALGLKIELMGTGLSSSKMEESSPESLRKARCLDRANLSKKMTQVIIVIDD